jgi:hypothetical protein
MGFAPICRRFVRRVDVVSKIDLKVPAEGGIELGDWLFLPTGDGIRPAITMAHGFARTKEHGLERFARAFAAAGFVVLVHDHRNFGTSGGGLRGARVAAQRSRRTIFPDLLCPRRHALGVTLAAPGFDRIDATLQLGARLVRHLARTRQARAGCLDAAPVGRAQAQFTTLAAGCRIAQNPGRPLVSDAKDQSVAIEGVAFARDLDLSRGRQVFGHARSVPPFVPPEIVASACILATSVALVGLYERAIYLASSSA